MPEDRDSDARSRWLRPRSILIVLVLVALPLVVILIAYLLFVRGPQRLLAAEIEAIRKAGEPLRLSDMAPPPVPENRNAAPLYLRAFEILNEVEPAGDQVSAALEAIDPTLLGKDEEAACRDFLARTREAVILLREASSRPACRFPNESSNPLRPGAMSFDGFRGASQLLFLDALIALRDGEMRRVEEDIVACLKLSDSVLGAPTLLSCLRRVGVAHQADRILRWVIGDPRLDPEACRRLSGEISRWVGRGALERCLLGERSEWLRKFRFLHEDGQDPHGSGETGGASAKSWLAGYARMEGVHYLRSMARLVGFARRPFYEVGAEMRTLAEGEDFPFYVRVIRIAMPNIVEVFKSHVVMQTSMETLGIALRLNASRGEAGEYPESLQDDRIDPFSGKPYLYRREGDGFVIYSVGRDLTDDGGQVDQPRGKGKDIGLRAK
ncbi:MAG: hypothetical protein O7H41_05115 [Planctomycetota bacterium]|nr:hypothetical protein [Planctomycetota bacterium]